MPYLPRTPCRHPGCARLVDNKSKYCEEHLPLHPEYTRSAGKRGYTSKWQRKRKLFLKNHPLCVMCKSKGKYIEATVVDHIVPHRGNEQLMWDESNWQALCKACHDNKTGNEGQNRIVVPKKWTNNTGGYYNNITVQFVMEVS